MIASVDLVVWIVLGAFILVGLLMNKSQDDDDDDEDDGERFRREEEEYLADRRHQDRTN